MNSLRNLFFSLRSTFVSFKKYPFFSIFNLNLDNNSFLFSRWVDFLCKLPPSTKKLLFKSNNKFFLNLNKIPYGKPHLLFDGQPTTYTFFSSRIFKKYRAQFNDLYWSVSRLDDRLLWLVRLFGFFIGFLKNFESYSKFFKFFYFFIFGLFFYFFLFFYFISFIFSKFRILNLVLIFSFIVKFISESIKSGQFYYFTDKKVPLAFNSTDDESMFSLLDILEDNDMVLDRYYGRKLIPQYEAYTPFSGYRLYFLTRYSSFDTDRKPNFLPLLKIYFFIISFFSRIFSFFFVLGSFLVRKGLFSFPFYFYFIYPAIYFLYFFDLLVFFFLRNFFLLITSFFYWFYYFFILPVVIFTSTTIKFFFTVLKDLIGGVVFLFSFFLSFFLLFPFFTDNGPVDWVSFTLFKFLNWLTTLGFTFESFFSLFYIFHNSLVQNSNKTIFVQNFTLDFLLFFSVFGTFILFLSFYFFPFFPNNFIYGFVNSSHPEHPESSLDAFDLSEHLSVYSEEDFILEDTDTQHPFEPSFHYEDVAENQFLWWLPKLFRRYSSRDGSTYQQSRKDFNFFRFLGVGPVLNEFFQSRHFYETTQKGFDVTGNFPNRFYSSPLENFDYLFLKINFFYTFSTNYSDGVSLFSNTAFYFDHNQKLFLSKLVNEFELSLFEFDCAKQLFNPQMQGTFEDLFLDLYKQNIDEMYQEASGVKKNPYEVFTYDVALESISIKEIATLHFEEITDFDTKTRLDGRDAYQLDSYARYLNAVAKGQSKEDFNYYLNKHDILLSYAPVGFFEYNPRFYSSQTMSQTSIAGLDSGFWLQDDNDVDTEQESDFFGNEEFFFYDNDIVTNYEDWDYKGELLLSWFWILSVVNWHSSIIMDNQQSVPLLWRHTVAQKSSTEEEDFYTPTETPWEWLDDVYPYYYDRVPSEVFSFQSRTNHLRRTSELDYYDFSQTYPFNLKTSWQLLNNFYFKYFFFDSKSLKQCSQLVDFYFPNLYKDSCNFDPRQNYYQSKYNYFDYPLSNFALAVNKLKVSDLTDQKYSFLFYIQNYKGILRTSVFDSYFDIQLRPFKYVSEINLTKSSLTSQMFYNYFERLAQNRIPFISSFWTFGYQYPWHLYLTLKRYPLISSRYSWGWGLLNSSEHVNGNYLSTAGRKKRVVYDATEETNVYSGRMFKDIKFPLYKNYYSFYYKYTDLYSQFLEIERPGQKWRTFYIHDNVRYRSFRDHAYTHKVVDSRDAWYRRVGYKLNVYERLRRAPSPNFTIHKNFYYYWAGDEQQRVVKRVFSNYFTPFFKEKHVPKTALKLTFYKNYYDRFHRTPAKVVSSQHFYSQPVRFATQPKITYLNYYDRSNPSVFGKRFGAQHTIADMRFERVDIKNQQVFWFDWDIQEIAIARLFYNTVPYLGIKLTLYFNKFFEFFNLIDWYIYLAFTGTLFSYEWFGDDFFNFFQRYLILFFYHNFEDFSFSRFFSLLTESLNIPVFFPIYFFSAYTFNVPKLRINRYTVDTVAETWLQILGTNFSDFTFFEKLFYVLPVFPQTIIAELDHFYYVDPFQTILFCIIFFFTVISGYFMRFFINTDVWFQRVDAGSYAWFLHHYVVNKPIIWFKAILNSNRFKSGVAFYTSKVFNFDPLLIYKLFTISQTQGILVFNDYRDQYILYTATDVDQQHRYPASRYDNSDYASWNDLDPYLASQDNLISPLTLALIDPEAQKLVWYLVSTFPPPRAHIESKSKGILGTVEPIDNNLYFQRRFNEFFLDQTYSEEIYFYDTFYQKDIQAPNNSFLEYNNFLFKDGSFITSPLLDSSSVDVLNSSHNFSSFNFIDFKLLSPYVSYYETLLNTFVIPKLISETNSNTKNLTFINDNIIYADRFSDYIHVDGHGFVGSINHELFYRLEFSKINDENPMPYYLLEYAEVINVDDSWKYNINKDSVLYFGSVVGNDYQTTDRQALFELFMQSMFDKFSYSTFFEINLRNRFDFEQTPIADASYKLEKTYRSQFSAYIYSADFFNDELEVLYTDTYFPITDELTYAVGQDFTKGVEILDYRNDYYGNPTNLYYQEEDGYYYRMELKTYYLVLMILRWEEEIRYRRFESNKEVLNTLFPEKIVLEDLILNGKPLQITNSISYDFYKFNSKNFIPFSDKLADLVENNEFSINNNLTLTPALENLFIFYYFEQLLEVATELGYDYSNVGDFYFDNLLSELYGEFSSESALLNKNFISILPHNISLK